MLNCYVDVLTSSVAGQYLFLQHFDAVDRPMGRAVKVFISVFFNIVTG